MDITEIAIATLAAFIAGVVDAIAGGGGTITVPVLLLLGVPPQIVLGTNKLCSSSGTAAATWTYLRSGVVSIGEYKWSLFLAGVGGVIGALLTKYIPAQQFEKVIGAVIIVLSLYYLLSPKIGTIAVNVGRLSRFLAPTCASIGCYDGVLGPGTGAFYSTALIKLKGLNFLEATAVTKALNLISNLTALVIFLSQGAVLWSLGIPMAIANVAGGILGARIGMRGGAQFVRKIFIFMALATALRLFTK